VNAFAENLRWQSMSRRGLCRKTLLGMQATIACNVAQCIPTRLAWKVLFDSRKIIACRVRIHFFTYTTADELVALVSAGLSPPCAVAQLLEKTHSSSGGQDWSPLSSPRSGNCGSEAAKSPSS
jgi:hypothetical protein